MASILLLCSLRLWASDACHPRLVIGFPQLLVDTTLDVDLPLAVEVKLLSACWGRRPVSTAWRYQSDLGQVAGKRASIMDWSGLTF
jgi:hypothetical protein